MNVTNNTPFEFIALPGYDKDGREVLTNIVKGTFSIHGNRTLKIADLQTPITMADEHWGDPGTSPVRYESDLALFKPTTDLILIGSAYHPKGEKTKKIEVVFGGGSKKKRETVECSEARARIPLDFPDSNGLNNGWFTPENLGKGFGFYPKQYKPRVDYAGTYDERWKKDRFPFLPIDFDYRFFQGAYPELIADRYFKGNERVFAESVSPRGPIVVDLPGIDIEIESLFERKTMQSKALLDTVILEPDQNGFFLVWRQMVPCQGIVKDLQGFRITMSKVSSSHIFR